MPAQQNEINALIGEGYRLHQAGNLSEAEKLYKQVLAIDPENAEVYQLWGHIAEATKNYAAAAELMRRSLSIDSSQAQVWFSYALLLVEIRQDNDAIKALESAIQLRPDYAEAHFNLGLAMVATGRPEEAPQHWRKAISLKPDYVEAYRVLTAVGMIEPGSAEFDEIEKLIANKDLAAEDRFVLHYALANIYKKSDDRAAFAKHLFAANRVQSECAPANPEGASPHERIKAAFTVENMERASQAPASDLTPIFIVGMPRSGTTLIERILASHSLVEAGEELQFLHSHAAGRFTQETGKPFPEGFQDLSAAQLGIIAKEYTDRTQHLFPNAAYITDKNPGNFFAIGLIKILMPNAKVIAVHRDPMDTCFSILRNTFDNKMRYCCDLEFLATYYREYFGLMELWHKVTPGFALDVRYEDIIKDQEGQTRRLLEFCGLEWDDACLEFFHNEKAVRTLSASQVRQPIYSSSIGNWKKYRKELAPLIDVMGDLVVD